MIAQMQERCLRPALEKLVPIMAISCWAYVPKDLEIVFQPIMTTSPAEKAELVQKMTADVIEAFKCGLITQEQAVAELESRGEGLGVYTKLGGRWGREFNGNQTKQPAYLIYQDIQSEAKNQVF
jgi:hypothetical protein